MKKFLLTLCSVFMAAAAWAQAPTHLRVNHVSGETVIVSFESAPEVTILGDGIKITSVDQEPVTFEFDEISHLDFPVMSKLDELPADAVQITATPQGFIFTNVPQDTPLFVVNLAGQLVHRTVITDGTYTLPRNAFATGVYVVKLGNSSFKISL